MERVNPVLNNFITVQQGQNRVSQVKTGILEHFGVETSAWGAYQRPAELFARYSEPSLWFDTINVTKTMCLTYVVEVDTPLHHVQALKISLNTE